MDFKSIKNDSRYFWTAHSKYKIMEYNLSPSMVKRVIRFPERTEEGIAPNTIAVMKRKDTKTAKREVWAMYQKGVEGSKFKVRSGGKIKIISAWIYPGESPIGKKIYIPDDVRELLEKQANFPDF